MTLFSPSNYSTNIRFLEFRLDGQNSEVCKYTRVKMIKFRLNLAHVSAQFEVWPKLEPNLDFETLPNLVIEVVPNFFQAWAKVEITSAKIELNLNKICQKAWHKFCSSLV